MRALCFPEYEAEQEAERAKAKKLDTMRAIQELSLQNLRMEKKLKYANTVINDFSDAVNYSFNKYTYRARR